MGRHRSSRSAPWRLAGGGWLGKTCIPLLAMMLVATACGGGSETTDGGSLEKPATKPDKIIVRAWGDPYSTGIQESAGEAFTADTGIQVEFDLSTTGDIQAKVAQAVQAGNRPPVDVVYTTASRAEVSAVQNLSVALDTAIVTNFDKLLPVGKPDSGGTNYVNVYTYTTPIVYNKAEVTPPADMSWNDLLKPEYRNSFMMQAYYQTPLYPVAKMLGLDVATDDLTPVWDWVRKMKSQTCGVGADVEFIEFMKSGQCFWGGTLIGDAFPLQDAGMDVGWIVPKEGAALLRDAMYVPRGLPDDVTYYAQLFVNYVIDAQNLTEWTSKIGTVPTNSESELREDLRGDPAFPFTEEEIAQYAVVEPVAVAAEHDDEWQAAYTAALQG